MPSETRPSPIFDNLDHIVAECASNSGGLAVLKNPLVPFEEYVLGRNFLYAYRGSEATFNAYRRELERFFAWCWWIKEKTLKEIKREDIEAFVEFCISPPLSWIGTKNVARFHGGDTVRIANPNWRPFVANITKKDYAHGKKLDQKNYRLSQSGIAAIFAILSSFYEYLIQEDKIAANPVRQIRQKSRYIRKKQNTKVIRRLSELQWTYIIEVAEKMAKENPALHERTLFMVNALYAMYLRISELAANARWTPEMGDFKRDTDGNWWFTTVGKGNKERMISVSDAMLEALKRYRIYLNLSPLPAPGEETPLIYSSKTNTAITSTRRIREIVQSCFDRATTELRLSGFDEEADALMSATVHWLRHTGISEDVKIRPREHVRDDAGHSSSAITDKYIDIELRARHASAKSKTIKPF